MTRPALHTFGRNEAGTTLVEYGIVLALMILLFFALTDFGRLFYRYTASEKAIQIAARIATVRPPVCAGVPDTTARGTSTDAPNAGTLCRSGANYCADPGTFTCAGAAGNATADEIWARIEPLLPYNSEIGDLQFTYSHDPDLGFIGGPYVPNVTVALERAEFSFVTPLAGLAAMAGSTGGGTFGTISFPVLSTTLPGEDLALGTDG